MESKTIFIIVDSGTAIRNLLRTSVLKTLKDQGNLQVVVFSPITDTEFLKEIESPNVTVERNPVHQSGFIFNILDSLEKDIWAIHNNLFTFTQKRKKKFGYFLKKAFFRFFLKFSRRSPQDVQKFLSKLKLKSLPLLGTDYFKKYNPSMVFYATLYSRNLCLEHGAKQRGIPSVAFVLSWDNPTSKGPFPVRPDCVIVWNDILKRELIRYHDYKEDELFVSGVPQFDIYSQQEKYITKKAFFDKWQLVHSKKLITYTTGTPGTSPFDHEVIDLLVRSMKDGGFSQPVQLLIRLHPKDREEDYDRFRDLPEVILQSPGRKAETNDSWNPSEEDMYGLAELMLYSDAVINVASTITIDAAAFDTPVVNIAYDGYSTRKDADSCRRYYQYEHYRPIVEAGGVKIAYNNAETVRYTDAYLINPRIDAEGRKQIVDQQCYKLDGGSGLRIAEYLLSI
jgi:hypothetical protein